MRNDSKKITAWLPHRWLELKGLSRLYTGLFYATLAVGMYAAGCWIHTFCIDPAELAVQSAPLRKIYLLAFLQSLLACLGWALLLRLCRALQQLEQALGGRP